ncbi:Hypothetical protein AA314_06607 [Archangium gephyra]|uniref:Uncharacterized protein n=1 Tax=Archangium gephyra TaxID=48 RepID=A0AAC8THX0_9BACT|nr:Hypothetical protein AA314_06607 [Archangium gephyra]
MDRGFNPGGVAPSPRPSPGGRGEMGAVSARFLRGTPSRTDLKGLRAACRE